VLKDYAKKRDFEVTPEPSPDEQSSGGSGLKSPLSFVVQKHAATRLHYDVRLELDGALVSWAVPKGPSLNPQDKRMAVKVEDHPLSYGGFEGTIPQGEYGGGEVIVWDRGTYHPIKVEGDKKVQQDEVRLELGRGLLEVFIEGHKLHGAFVLVHTHGNQWLMKKMQDDFASTADVLLQDRSVVTGHRIGGVADAAHSSKAADLPLLSPMLPTEVDKPFTSDDWTFELKLDGVRLLAYLQPGGVRLISRNGNDVTTRLPKIVKELEPYIGRNAILDGEVVVFDEAGRPNFHTLMEGFQAGTAKDAVLCFFDIPYLDGKDLGALPWTERRKQLESVGIAGPHIRLLDVYPHIGEILYKQATELGLEGIIGKRLDSRYEAGRRSKDWVKVKGYHTEEFLIGGYTAGEGARAKAFGALMLGTQTEKGFEWIGNAGGGFNDRDLDEVKAELEKLQTDESPFVTRPPGKGLKWVKPELVAEIRFQNWTKDHKLRFPIFQRLRPDLTMPEDHRTEEQPSNLVVEDSSEPNLAEIGRDADAVLKALASEESDLRLTVGGHEIHFSSLDKEYWPGVKKRDLIAYYASVSETLLEYLKDRPLSFVRTPEGMTGERFFQKHWDKGRPPFVDVVSIHSDHNGGARDFVICNNLATLLWLGQIAAVELNPWMSRVTPNPDGKPEEVDFSTSRESLEGSLLNRPDFLIFDLDPHFGGKASGWKKAEWDLMVEVAMTLKDILAGINLNAYPKSSGKSGLHIYVPVEREYTYDQIRSAGFTIGQQVFDRLGRKVTLEYSTRKRPDGVFIDVNQNIRGKTMAAAYSPRAGALPGVSMPLAWNELHRVDPTQFDVCTAPDRLRKKGDLWREILSDRQRLIG
jgi:bifunctional non-homologous end joining protein LigD